MMRKLALAVAIVGLAALLISCEEEREYTFPQGWTTSYIMQAEMLSDGITDLWFNGPNDGWACVDDKILRYDGFQWRVVHGIRKLFPEDVIFFKCVCAVNAHNIWAVGGWGWMDNDFYHFDGDTWEKVAAPPVLNILDIYFPSPEIGWAATSDGVYRYANGSWTLDIPGTALDLCFLTPDNGWAAVSTYIYHWNGAGWTRVELCEMDDGGISDISAASADVWWAVGVGYEEYEQESYPFHLFYRYDGTSWDEVNWPEHYYRIEKCGVAADGTGWVLQYPPWGPTQFWLHNGTRMTATGCLGNDVVNGIWVLPSGETWVCATTEDTTVTRIWHCPRCW